MYASSVACWYWIDINIGWYQKLKYPYRIGSENIHILWNTLMDFDDMTHMQSKDLFFHVTCTKSCDELSVLVFIHHFGLRSLGKTVDCDRDVRATEHLFQNPWHSVPVQSIQATANAARETGEGGGRLRARDGVQIPWCWGRRGHLPRHRHPGHSVPLALRLHVLQARSQAVVGRLVARSSLCDLQRNRGTSVWNAWEWHKTGWKTWFIFTR